MLVNFVFVVVLAEFVWTLPLNRGEDEIEKSLVEYLDWYYDVYVEQKGKNDVVEDDIYDRMQSDQPSPQDTPAFNRSDNQSDLEYIRMMRDRTKDIWIQMLKDNIMRQVGRTNATAPKPKDKVDVAGLNISHLLLVGQIPSDAVLDDLPEKIRSYYPSCEIPKNTDQDLWKDENTMNLYFDVEYPESAGVIIATAMLRLYRTPATNATSANTESSCENTSNDEQLMRVSIYWYTKSLKRQRVKRRLSDSKVIGDNAKWVELSVLPATRAWGKGKNLGLAVIVEDQEGTVLKADKYFKGASCMVGASTPKPIPTVIIDAARWANELERVNGSAGGGASAAFINNLSLLPTLDVCTVEFPQNSTHDQASLTSWRKACDLKRAQIQGQKMLQRDLTSTTTGARHIRHQKQHMHDFNVDPRSRIVGQKVIMTNEELRNLNARPTNRTNR